MSRNKKLTVECLWCLDIGPLSRAGALVAGAQSQYVWHQAEQQVSALQTTMEGAVLRLDYQARGKTYSHAVKLDYTDCNYGGQRAWFICPARGCGRRVTKLYRTGLFICRHCLRLAYDSQSESEVFRVLRRSKRLREKLKLHSLCFGLPAARVGRPKGMHAKTYLRLIMQLRANDDALPTFITG